MSWLIRPIARGRLPSTLGRIAAAAMLVAALLLAWRFPARWSGVPDESTSTNAYVTLQPPSAAQVAHLLTMSVGGAAGPPGTPESRGASVVAVDGDDVTVVTGQDAFSYTDRPDSARIGTAWVSWNGYVVEHHVSKTALQAALGRELRESERSAAPEPHRVSYRSDRWIRYVAAEFALLSALLGLGILAVRVIRWPLLPLALLGWFALWSGVVDWFSPAFWDADFFHQRVVIEDVVIVWVYAAIPLAPLAVVAPLSAFAIAAARAMAARWGRPGASRFAWVAAAFPPAALLAAAAGVWAWQGAAQLALAREAASTLDPQVLAELSERGSALSGIECRTRPLENATHEQQALCAKVRVLHWGQEWQPGLPPTPFLLVPVDADRVLFVMTAAPEPFADVRALRSGAAETIGAEVAERAIGAGAPSTSGFGGWLLQELVLRGEAPDAAVPIVHEGRVVGVMVAGGW